VDKRKKGDVPTCSLCQQVLAGERCGPLTMPTHQNCHSGIWCTKPGPNASNRELLVRFLLRMVGDAASFSIQFELAAGMIAVRERAERDAPLVRPMRDSDRGADNRAITVAPGRHLENDLAGAFQFFGPLKGRAR
jgi:hypothetical protein